MRSLVRVVDLGALVERARVDAEVGELAVGVGHDLEGQRGERRLLVGRALERLVALQVHARGRRDVERRRQEVDDGVEQRLHALVLEGGAVQHGHDAEAMVPLRMARRMSSTRELLVAEVLLHEVVVLGGHDVEQLGPPLLGLRLELGGDLLDASHFAPSSSSSQTSAVHRDEVDDALVVALGADRAAG